MYMRAACASEYGSHMGSISFLSHEKPFPMNRAIILHSMDSFLKRPVGMRSEKIAKKAEKSRGVSDTRYSVMKIT